MSTKSQNERILFGLKLKQLRQKKNLSFAELAAETGMSISYLNEIEKGKKFPKEEKLDKLAAALDVSTTQLLRNELDNSLAPVEELLKSNFLHELPLDMFGIDISKVAELIADAPTRVGAFITTLIELARSYALREENFYFGALRSYLELNNNYFEDIELAAQQFCTTYHIDHQRPLPPERLQYILEQQYSYQVDRDTLDRYPELSGMRSVFLPHKKKLLLSGRLSNMQRGLQFGKELGFQYLQLKERAYTAGLISGRSFEEVLNHSRAIYFSVALHLPLHPFVEDVRQFLTRSRWQAEAFLAIMQKYEASPEMFFHRLTNVLPHYFNIHKLFFLRVAHDIQANRYEIDRELHLSRRHHPHGNGLLEHYCRRWISISLLADLLTLQQSGKFATAIVGIQRSKYAGTEDEYLCITLARPSASGENLNVSVTLGLLVNKELPTKIGFLNDPSLQFREVNKTCERCAIENCGERAAPAIVVSRRESLKAIQARCEWLDNQ